MDDEQGSGHRRNDDGDADRSVPPHDRRRRADDRPPARRTGGPAVAAVMVLAGLLFATSAGLAGGTNLRNDSADLPRLVRGEASRLNDLEHEVGVLRTEVNGLTAAVDDATVQRLQASASATAGPAHLTAVTGPGLEVVLDDAPTDVPLPDGVSPDDLVVHQQDLQAVVNALWAAGAEAMMLMDQRVISTSAVRCVGSTLRLQGRVYSPPYTIRAIGDPDTLRRSLDRSPQVSLYREYVRAVGLGYEVGERRSLDMPAFDGATDLRFASVPAG